MNIYRPNKELLVEGVPVTSSAIHVQELMQADYIRLSWSASEYQELPIGSYIEHEGVEFAALQVYKPSMRSEAEYYYEVDFHHPFMRLQYTPCLFKTRNAEGKEVQETDWEYVGSLGAILTRLSDIIKEQVGWELSFVIVGDVPSSATCSFAGNDIFSALNHVAQAFGAEWCVDWAEQKVYYGENITLGESVLLQEGTNVGVASINKNSADVANSYIVRGGTRNITILTASGDNVQTDTRLSLEGYTDPNGKTYDSESVIDLRTDESEPRLPKVLIFDNVYPHLDLYITDIRSRTRRLLDDKTNQPIPLTVDAEGNPTSYRMYAIYYVQLAYEDKTTGELKDYRIDPLKDIVKGKELTASFEPNEDSLSALAGRGFKMTYHKYKQILPASEATGDTGVEVKEGDFEINFVKEGELIIPNVDTLAPSTGDKVVLYNVVMGDEYLASAKSELYAEATKEITRLHGDMNNYTLQSNVVTYNQTLNVGSAVQYKSLNGYTLNTRVLKLEQKIDIPSDVKITIGNAEVKGNIQSLKEEVALANNEVSAMQAMNEAANAMTTAITNTQNSLKEAMAQWQNMWKFDDDGNVFSPYNVYSKQDISAFGYIKTELPSASVVIEQLLTSGTEIARINGTTIYAPAGGGGTPDLSNYYTKTEVDNLIPSLTGFATEKWVTAQGFLTSANLTDYATQSWVENKGYALTSDIPSDYVKEATFVEFKGNYDNLAAAVTAANGYTDDQISALNIGLYATNSALTQAISGANATAQEYANSALANANSYANEKFVTKADDWEEIDGIKVLNGTYTFFKKLYIEPESSYGAYIGWQNGPAAMNILTNGRIKFHQGIQDNIELYGSKDAQGNGVAPFLDFHFNDTVTGFSSRIWETASGVLELFSSEYNPGTLKIGNAYLTYDSDNNALMVSDGSGGAVNLVAMGDVAAFGGLGSGFDTLTDLTLTNKLAATNVETKKLTAKTSATIAGVKFYEDDDYCPVIDLSGDGENVGYITGADAFIMDRALVKKLQLYDSVKGNYKDIEYDGDNGYVYITINSVKYKFVMEKV